MRKWCIVEILNGKSGSYILTDYGEIFLYSELFQGKKLLNVVGNGSWRAYITMIEYENKLIFPPYLGKDIAIYDLEEKRLQYIPISLKHEPKERKFNLYKKAVVWKEKAFFIGDMDSSLISLDMKTYKVEKCTKWQTEFKKQFGESTGTHTHTDLCVVDHCFWISLQKANFIMEYDMEKNVSSFYRIGDRKIHYNTICFDGKEFWLSGDKQFLCKWNKKENVIEFFEKFPDDFEINLENGARTELFSCSILWNQSIYYAPLSANMYIRVDLKSQEIKQIEKRGKTGLSMVLKSVADGKMLYGEEMDCERSEFFKNCLINKDNSLIKMSILFTQEEEIQFLERIISLKMITREKGSQSLQYLCSDGTSEREENRISDNQNTEGREIYYAIKG